MKNIYLRIFVLTIIGSACVCRGEALAQNFADLNVEDKSVNSPSEQALAAQAAITEETLKGASSEEILQMIEPTVGEEIVGEVSEKYTLGATDVIEIKVMRHPEVSGEYPINMEGKVQYEFVGDIRIAGMTKEEAAETISEKLSEYIVSPEVNIKIIGYNSKIVYVVGEVFRPGKIFMRGDTITVREALMQAGLPRLSGVTKKSRLIKPEEGKKALVKKNLNVYALLYEGDLRYNEIMEPGDVLYIPPTFLTRVMRSIAPVAAPIGQAAGVHTGIGTLGTPVGERNY